ncbi:MAG: primosomal protein N' [Rhodothalassiaceae bacterium]
MAVRLPVLLPLPFEQAFDYVHDEALPPGTVVRVPFGPTERYGVVWPTAAADPVAATRLKPLARLADVPPLPADLIALIDKLAAYTLTPLGSVLRLALSTPAALETAPVKRHLIRTGAAPERLTPARRRVLDRLADGLPRTAADLAREAGVSAGVVLGLEQAGTLSAVALPADPEIAMPDPALPAPALRPEQEEAAQSLRAAVEQQAFAPMLLDGVTGSGKTEVYFEAVAKALAQTPGQVLVLVPEIALTAQWLERFASRFGCSPVAWHSGLTQAQRRQAWRAAAEGRARVVVGARSALFLPLPALALIIVDEEHDPSFKQEDGVLYHARDMAVWRAQLARCPVVLVSATPSLETRLNAQEGRYAHVRLRQRHGRAVLPRIQAVDMRKDGAPPGRWLSPVLERAVEARLKVGEQTLLFLNRRGYAPLTLCRACGARIECPNCSAWLVEHRYLGALQCHHCGYQMAVPDTCPQCHAPDTLVPCGPGIERLAEEVLSLWPQARLAVMASDTLDSPAQTAAMIGQIANGLIDIVVGTQLVAKGYHFPKLTLVGVIDADLGLRGGDLRAGERTYQQLVQVAGRAGREDRPGQVLLQSFDPGHPVVHALISGNAARFMALEEQARRHAHMPPFARLAGIVISGPDLPAVTEAGRRLARAAPKALGVDIWGPAPAPLARLRGAHRHRFLVRADKSVSIQRLVRHWLGRTALPAKVRVRVDIDPISFL